jgi:hypothetical protein
MSAGITAPRGCRLTDAKGLGRGGKIPITIPVCGGPWLTPAKLDGGSQSSDKRFRRNTAIPPRSYQMSGLVR